MKIPLLRLMDALSKSAIRALRLLGDDESQRVFTTVDAEQEYFLIDEQYYFERPDLVTTGRTLFGAKPPKGHELDDHYFGSIPERILACMLEAETEMAKLGIPVKTRHNEVAPNQYEIATRVRELERRLGPPAADDADHAVGGRRYGLVCLLHEKPFAGVWLGEKHNNWSMGTDTGHNLMDLGDTPAENTNFLFFCAAVIQAVSRHQGLLRASVYDIGQDYRFAAPRRHRRSSRSSSAPAGEGLRSDRDGRGRPHTPARSWSWLRCCRRCRCTAATETGPRRSVHRQQVRVPRARVEHVALVPEHGAEHDRRRGD